MTTSSTNLVWGHGPYMNPMTDYAFKKMFGPEGKPAMIDLLNSILPDLTDPIEDIEYLPTEHLGDQEKDRIAIFDLHCVTQSGAHFIVELQKTSQSNYRERTIYYATFPIREQAKKGGWDYALAPVYVVSFLNFTLEPKFTTPEEVVTRVRLCNVVTREVFYDKLTFMYIELPRFEKESSECEQHREMWIYLLRNLGTIKSVDELPDLAREEVFMEFLSKAQIAALDETEQRKYFQSLKIFNDNYAIEKTLREEGYEKGLAEGMERGMEKGIEKGISAGKREVALQMRKEGLDAKAILKLTGVSISDLESPE